MIKKHIYFSLLYVLFGFTYAHAEEPHPAVAFYNTLSETEKQRCINKVIFNEGYQQALLDNLYSGATTDINSNTKNETGLTSITAEYIKTLCQNDLGRTIETLTQRAEKNEPVIVYYWQMNRDNFPIQTLGIEPSNLLDKLRIDVGILMSPKGDFKLGDTVTRDVWPHNNSCTWAPHSIDNNNTYNFILNSAVRHLINESKGALTANKKVEYGYRTTSYNCAKKPPQEDTNFFPGILTFENEREDEKPWHSSEKYTIMANSVPTLAAYIHDVCAGTIDFINSNINRPPIHRAQPDQECQQFKLTPLYLYLVATNIDNTSNAIKTGELGKYQGVPVKKIKILSAPHKITIGDIQRFD